MKTRLLESREIIRATAAKAEVLEATGTVVLLKTTAQMAVHTSMQSAGTDMFGQHLAGQAGASVEGRARFDILSDDTIRVRYAEGDTVPANLTEMVVGTPTGPSKCAIEVQNDRVVVTTGKVVLTVFFDYFRYEVRDLHGNILCGVGGDEKDQFHNWDSYNMGICRAKGDGAPIAVENFDLHYDEAIFGLGEHFIKLNKVGQTIDQNMTDGLGVITPRAYKNVPFHVSSHGYGVFFNHSSLMTYWVGSMTAADVQVAVEDEFLDYYLFFGTIKEVLSLYTDITGKGKVPPKWSFGFWQGKFTYHSAAETLEIARAYRATGIPCDVIHVDTDWFAEDWHCDFNFDPVDFPDPKAYFAEMNALGFKVSLWQMPYILEDFQIYKDLEAAGALVKNAEGGVYNTKFFIQYPEKISAAIDFTHPEGVRIYQEYLRGVLQMGAMVIKTDFGEAAPVDGIYFDGKSGMQNHNLYPLLYNKAAFEVTQEVHSDEAMVWARSAWAGSQRYPIHWGGDNSANRFNMEPQLAGGLSLGLSGFQFWSHDIAGFSGDMMADEEATVRWMQLGLFVSHSRIHGLGDREIYKLSPRLRDICADFIKLRYRLMPYIYGSAIDCVSRSLPMARPLVVEYQDDPTTYNLSAQYLFGENLLVAPIFGEAPCRRVYLPEGVWTDWWTKERIAGGRWILAEVPLEQMPLYIREGALIPMGPVMQYVDEFPVEEIAVLVAPFSGDGCTRFTIPVNDAVIPVEYVAEAGTHIVLIGSDAVRVRVEPLAEVEMRVQLNGGSESWD